MTEVSSEWRWVGADGVESIVDEWELVASLSSGALPHYTLIWRTGWSQWLPACRVPELAAAVGDKAEHSLQPGVHPGWSVPPAPPLYRYRAFRGGEPTTTESGHARMAPRVERVEPLKRPEHEAGALLGRRPMPTLMDDDLPLRGGSTLRPPTAVPPPPRTMPRPPSATQAPAEPGELWGMVLRSPSGPVSAPAAPHRVGVSRPPDPPVVPAIEAEPLTPVTFQAPTSPTDRLAIMPGGAPPISDPMPSLASDLVMPPLQGSASPPHAPRLLVLVAATTTVTSVLAGGAALALFLGSIPGRHAPGAPLALAGASPSSSSVSPGVRQCLLSRSARRLAPSVERTVSPELVATEGGRLALGFAESAEHAKGLLLNPETLSAQDVFQESGTTPLLGVVPVQAGKRLTFHADRRTDQLASPRTLDAEHQLGITAAGLVRLNRSGATHPLWPELAGQEITVPRTVATVRGQAVTFRRGGQSGKVLLGWLGTRGEPLSPLSAIPFEGWVGAPSLSSNGPTVLVTVASRPDEDAKWGIALARARQGQPLGSTKAWVLPRGGPGVEAISPSVTGLPNGGWLLQWTEGATGNRQVRVQTLAPDLTPVGDALTLSAQEDNAGQGVIHAIGNRAVSLFVVLRNNTRQLWAAGLECP